MGALRPVRPKTSPAKTESRPSREAQSEMVLNRQRRIPVATKPLAEFLERARRELGFPEQSVAVQLVSDAAMSQLNWTFRRKRGTTDVLSFPARPQRGPRAARPRRAANAYVGDIAISPETARRNACRESRTLPDELRLLLLHGLIHLAGYDHETDQGQMQELERALRRRLGLSSE
jgi:probable rRNA maturation factor